MDKPSGHIRRSFWISAWGLGNQFLWTNIGSKSASNPCFVSRSFLFWLGVCHRTFFLQSLLLSQVVLGGMFTWADDSESRSKQVLTAQKHRFRGWLSKTTESCTLMLPEATLKDDERWAVCVPTTAVCVLHGDEVSEAELSRAQLGLDPELVLWTNFSEDLANESDLLRNPRLRQAIRQRFCTPSAEGARQSTLIPLPGWASQQKLPIKDDSTTDFWYVVPGTVFVAKLGTTFYWHIIQESFLWWQLAIFLIDIDGNLSCLVFLQIPSSSLGIPCQQYIVAPAETICILFYWYKHIRQAKLQNKVYKHPKQEAGMPPKGPIF